MKIAVIGLGRMGSNISRRLMGGGHDVVAFDLNPASVQELVGAGAIGAASLEEGVSLLQAPRIFWVMLPAGGPTEDTIAKLRMMTQPGDVIIDGGNTFFKEDIRRAVECREAGIHYVDVGTSGGIWGLERGYCLMIGGDDDVIKMLDPIFDTLAPGYGTVPRTDGRAGTDDRPERGYIHAGPAGAGHFVKMVHNGIEYGLMQAYAEGFDILKNRMSEKLPEEERFTINVPDVAEVWRRGSVISSWLLDLCALGL
ncbi:MAG: NADP-dependent phosphogluconate dehydrogenase, partial [Sphingomonas sp.]|nr:NADP-dependent phosphogluconate dehydrogenase [Sphingomonas sp.]